MVAVSSLAILVHAALRASGYQACPAVGMPGYVVAANKVIGNQWEDLEVLHTPETDDQAAHVQAYYAVLQSDMALANVRVQLIMQPYPHVLVVSR